MIAWLIGVFLLTQAVTTPVGTGTIEGRVVTADGKPITEIRVSAIEIAPDSQSVTTPSTLTRIVQTGSDGRFRLDNIPPGRYYVAAGLIDFPTFYPGVATASRAEAVSVRAGASIENVNITVLSEAGGVVGGRILGISPSLPFPLRVRLSAPSIPLNQYVVAVDATGSFQFPRMLPGEYDLSVVQNNPGSKPVHIVIHGDDVRNLEILAPLMIVGRIVVDDGRPLPYAAATRPNPRDASITLSVNHGSVRADGGFGINSVTPGASYRIEVTGIPFGYYLKAIVAGSIDLMKDSLDLTGPLSPEIVVTLTTSRPASESAGVKVSGRVTGFIKPLADAASATITLTSQLIGVAGSHSGEASAHADGTFEFLDVPPGTYGVRVALPGKPTTNTTLTVGEAGVKDYEIAVSTDVRN